MRHLKPISWVLGIALVCGPAMIATAQDGRWQPNEPEGQWSRAWHSGFRDGVDAARHDIDARRSPDPDRHDKFRHPDLPRDERGDFRDGFRRGYHEVFEHTMGDRGYRNHHHDDDDHPYMR